MQPVIDYMSVPGDALQEIPDEDVPPVAQDLHDSALTYYQSLPEQLKTVSNDGLSTEPPATDDLEAAQANNLEARQAIRKACPSVMDEIEASEEETPLLDLASTGSEPDSVDADVFDDMEPTEYQEASFAILSF